MDRNCDCGVISKCFIIIITTQPNRASKFCKLINEKFNDDDVNNEHNI